MLKTFKAIIKPLATYAGPAWHQLMSDTQMAKLERQYIGGLKACCGLTKDTPKELVYYETKMMPLKEELELGSEQFAISAMRTPGHPAKDLHTRRPAERSSGNRPRTPPLEARRSKEDEWRRQRGDTKSIQKRNHTVFVKRYLGIRQIHPTLGTTPPQVSQDEEKMPRSTRVELARLRSQRSLMLEDYKAKVENRAISPCIKCGKHEGDLCHLLRVRNRAPSARAREYETLRSGPALVSGENLVGRINKTIVMSEEVTIRRSFRIRNKKTVPKYDFANYLKKAIHINREPISIEKKKLPVKPQLAVDTKKKYDDIFSAVVANALVMEIETAPMEHVATTRKRNESSGWQEFEQAEADSRDIEEEYDVTVVMETKKKRMGIRKNPTGNEESDSDIIPMDYFGCKCGRSFQEHIECHKHIVTDVSFSKKKSVSNVYLKIVIDSMTTPRWASHALNVAIASIIYALNMFATVQQVVEHENQKHVQNQKQKRATQLHKCYECHEMCGEENLSSHYVIHIDVNLLFSRIADLQDKIQAQKGECPFCRINLCSCKGFRSHVLKRHYQACKSLISNFFSMDDITIPSALSDTEVTKRVNEVIESAVRQQQMQQTQCSLDEVKIEVKQEVKEELEDEGYPSC
uniref:Uncharacterized protein n=1 Tax=Caenorhabditis japonica TaxID=281687 RepID=A0A8R1DMY4_CAEJA